MISIHLDRISKYYGVEPVFNDLTWEIFDDRCTGLVGANGSGKSTLLRIIAGVLDRDGGFIVQHKDLKIGYLQQEPHFCAGNTLWQETYASHVGLIELEKKLNSFEKDLAKPEIYMDEKKLSRTLDRQAQTLEEFEKLGGLAYEGLVRSILFDLGFKAEDLNLPVEVLSGGQKKLLGLARLLVTRPDVLLLDEPDNHLDLEGKFFLEQFIRNFKGAVIIVSHDRYLLDLVADEIAELEQGELALFPGNYSEYVFEKELRLQRQLQVFQAQQKEINRLEQSANRLLAWGKVFDNEKFSKRGMNILKRLDKIERIDKPLIDPQKMRLELKGARGSDKVLEIKGLAKSFREECSERIILAGIDLLLMRGERVGLVGPNGAGKSLLFRLVLEQLCPDEGEIILGPSVRVAYYAQQHETLDLSSTLLETVRKTARFTEEGAVGFLKRFLFTYDQCRGRVSDLSGGERSRLQLALLMLSGANFLLLDEPTNNLDIASIEVLENALEDFEGTILTISHDRYFLDRIVSRICDLEDGFLEDYAGNFSDYQASKSKIART